MVLWDNCLERGTVPITGMRVGVWILGAPHTEYTCEEVWGRAVGWLGRGCIGTIAHRCSYIHKGFSLFSEERRGFWSCLVKEALGCGGKGIDFGVGPITQNYCLLNV